MSSLVYTRPIYDPSKSHQTALTCEGLQGANDMEKRIIGQHIRELVPSPIEEGQKCPGIFGLRIRASNALNSPDVDAILLKLYFRLRFTVLLGLHLF